MRTLQELLCLLLLYTCIFLLHWQHNELHGISNHQPHDCLLNRLFRRRSKKTSKLRVNGFCEGNSSVIWYAIRLKGPVTRSMFPSDDVMIYPHNPGLQYIPRNMHTFFALLCFVVVIHWLIFPYPSGLLHWHCGNLTIAPVPAKQPWWIWINTSCEFIMNDCITTTKQSTTKPCAYFLGYTVLHMHWGKIDRSNVSEMTLKTMGKFIVKFYMKWQYNRW